MAPSIEASLPALTPTSLRQLAVATSPDALDGFSERQSSIPPEQQPLQSPPTAISMWSNLLELPTRGLFDTHTFLPLFQRMDAFRLHRVSDALGKQAVLFDILHQLAQQDHRETDPEYRLALDVMDYLSTRALHRISMQDMAEHFHFSADVLARKMKRHTGFTPSSYVLSLRLDQAKNLLCNTDDTLAAIAMSVGWEDVSVFHKAFCKEMGLPPGQWRKKMRGISNSVMEITPASRPEMRS